MQPTGHLRGDAVHVAGDARQRFHDSNGYGRPLGGNEIALSRVETAHLLFRGDLSGVSLTPDADPVGFERFFVESAAAADRFAVRYLVYADLRDRGFYLSPAREPWPGGDVDAPDAVDFVAYERGSTPDTGDVKYPVQVVGERESLPAAGLAGRTLAVVDEESDITYFAATRGEIAGATDYEPPDQLDGVLLSDRVVVWDAPEGALRARLLRPAAHRPRRGGRGRGPAILSRGRVARRRRRPLAVDVGGDGGRIPQRGRRRDGRSRRRSRRPRPRRGGRAVRPPARRL